jgi:acyl dehydratase
MKFAELHPGQVITLGPVSLSERQIVEFARDHDPQWFHTDPEAAARGRWGGLIASGWQTCAVAMRLACDHVLAGSESIGSPGVAYLKWPAPVRPRERLTLRIDVLEVRRSARRPELGIVRWRWRLRHVDGRDALELEATSLFELGAGAPR